jgi:hypothetical protein
MASAMTTLIIDQHLRAWLMFLLAGWIGGPATSAAPSVMCS